MEPLVITGLGLVTPLGLGVAASWRRLLAGEHAIGPIKAFDASAYPARLAAEVDEGPADPARVRPTDRRATRLFLRAALEAVTDARVIDDPPSPRRLGVSAGVSVNYLHLSWLVHQWCLRTPANRVDIAALVDAGHEPPEGGARRSGDTVPLRALEVLGASGPARAIDTACTSGAHALVDACRLLECGEADVVVAGGTCANITPLTVIAFGKVGALSAATDPDRASRPFDRHRDGFVLGEGAAALVVERADRARRRGHRPYARIAGWACTTVPGSITEPSPGGRLEAAAISRALDAARLAPGDVDAVVAHGTSTPKNDANETAALKRALGSRAHDIPVVSNKGHWGHTLAAAGAVNLAVAALVVRHGMVPPTLNLREADPACDLDYVTDASRACAARHVLANAFGFGGQNVAVVLGS
jgi:3-oxoacyl-(acyl-carrier-protein) synthase